MSAATTTLTIVNDLTCLPQVRELVRRGIESGGFPGHYLNRLQIAVDEAVTNIIEHGYAGVAPGRGTITIALSADRACFRIVIEDDGRSFDPQNLPEVDVKKHAAAGHTGGLGIFLIRRVMDEIQYNFENGRRNQLVLVKRSGG
ncbi:MAG TPA: ATP-binding protein [Planctomycetota bacterium]|nr:ATP-binding protein [Planctomycetota bacterium]